MGMAGMVDVADRSSTGKVCCPWCGVEMRMGALGFLTGCFRGMRVRGMVREQVSAPWYGVTRVRWVCGRCGEGVRWRVRPENRGRVVVWWAVFVVMLGLYMAGMKWGGVAVFGWVAERWGILGLMLGSVVPVFGGVVLYVFWLRRLLGMRHLVREGAEGAGGVESEKLKGSV